MKIIYDEIFNKYFFQIKNKFHNLKLIDLTKCDIVNDDIIQKICDKFPWVIIINYYGRDLRNDFI